MRFILCCLVTFAALLLPSTAFGEEAEPFGVSVKINDDSTAKYSVVRQWKNIQLSLRTDLQHIDGCARNTVQCSPEAEALASILAKARALTGIAQLSFINRAVNQALIPTTDKEQWGEEERWSMPLETFRTKKGDCEDYLLAKYALLLLLGASPERMRPLIEQQRKKTGEDLQELHIVLAVSYESVWHVLDSSALEVSTTSGRNMELITPKYVLNWREALPRQEAAAQPAK